MAVLLTPPVLQFFDANGDPLAGGKLYTYIAGTTQPKQTFTSAAGNIAAPNPIILDSAGRATVWIAGSYKFELRDSLDNVISVTDNVTAFNITPAANASYFESFSGNGVQTAFTLSQNLGTDENAVMVFVDDGAPTQILNGDFATDTIWTKGAGWTIGSGVATATGAISTDLSQNVSIPIAANQAYVVTYTITRSAGTITPNLGGTPGVGRTANGTYTEVISAGSSQVFAFNTAGFTGTVDNVSVQMVQTKGREVLNPNQYTLTAGLTPTITFSVAPKNGTNNILIFAPSLLVGAASAAAAAAEASANAAAVSEINAAASAVLAANYAASLTGTSNTSVLIGTGTKNFTASTGKQWVVGQYLMVASLANVANYMYGQILSYNSGTGALQISVPATTNGTGGSGTFSDWVIGISGVQGIQGATGSGTANMKSQTYASGVGFTGGVTTTLTLTNTPIAVSPAGLFICFDGAIQQPTEWSYVPGTGVITFNTAIPLGVSQVYAFWFTDIAVGTPTAGSVIPASFADQSNLASGQCYLTLSGANVVLQPMFGNKVLVNRQVRSIGAGVSLAPKTLIQTTQRSRNASNVATLTTNVAHGLSVNDWVRIKTVGGTGYNTLVFVQITAVPTTTSFSYANTGSSEGTTADTAGRIEWVGYYTLRDVSGTLTLDLEPLSGGRTFDSVSGVPIYGGSLLKSVVGMGAVYNNAGTGAWFQADQSGSGSSVNQNWVLSYFNRQNIVVEGAPGQFSTTTVVAGGTLEISATANLTDFLLQCLSWGDEPVLGEVDLFGGQFANGILAIQMRQDGNITNPICSTSTAGGVANNQPFGHSRTMKLFEGPHNFTLWIQNGSSVTNGYNNVNQGRNGGVKYSCTRVTARG